MAHDDATIRAHLSRISDLSMSVLSLRCALGWSAALGGSTSAGCVTAGGACPLRESLCLNLFRKTQSRFQTMVSKTSLAGLCALLTDLARPPVVRVGCSTSALRARRRGANSPEKYFDLLYRVELARGRPPISLIVSLISS
jgi:hypothetical protein